MKRRRPLTLDDVRVDRWLNVEAAPRWAYDHRYVEPKPIPGLWRSLLAKLRQLSAAKYKADCKRYRASLKEYEARKAAGKLTQLDRDFGPFYGQPTKPQKVSLPDAARWARYSLICAECGESFFGPSHRMQLCSKRCEDVAKKRQQAVKVAKLTAQRATARDGRKCGYCGTLLASQRSTNKFCSAKCRVYASRKRAQKGKV